MGALRRSFAAAVLVAATVAVPAGPPAGAAGHLLLPKFDPHHFVPKPLRIVSIVPGDLLSLLDPHSFTTRLFFFGLHLPMSPWYRQLASRAEYNFDPHHRSTSVVYVDNSIPTATGDANESTYADYAAQVANAHQLPADPTRRTVYLLYVPCHDGAKLKNVPCGVAFHTGVSADDLAAHPHLFSDGDALAFEQFNVDQSDCYLNASCDIVTRAQSHEVAEAATDTGDGYRLTPSVPASPWVGDNSGYRDNSPWVESEGLLNAEVMDFTGDTRYVEHFHTVNGFGQSVTFDFIYRRIPHRKPSTADPWFPAIAGRYYSTTTASEWVDARTNSSGVVTIPMTGWSVGNVKPWTSSVEVATWDGGPGFLGGSADNPPCVPIVLPTNGHGGITTRTGQSFNVVVLISGTARWCVLRVKSHRYGDEAPHSTADTGDAAHDQMVGIILPAAA